MKIAVVRCNSESYMFRWCSPLAPSDEGAAAAAAEGEKAAVNRKLFIIVTFLSLRASPTSLIRGRLWSGSSLQPSAPYESVRIAG